MRSTSSTSLSDTARVAVRLAALLVLWGCASSAPPPLRAEEPFQSVPSAAPEAKAPVLGLEYGNRSTKATLQIDLGSEDVQVEMSGSPARRDTVKTVSVAPALQPAVPIVAPPPPPPPPPSAPSDSTVQKARRLVDSAVPHAAMPDSVTRRVVGSIRKAQEAFYKGRYPEAAESARKSIALWPTPEGWALLGSIQWTRGDKEEARRSWLKARELDPDFPGLAAMLESIPARTEAAP